MLAGFVLMAAACGGPEEPPELPPLSGDEPREERADTTADDADHEDEGEGDETEPGPVDRSGTHRVVESPRPVITLLHTGAEPRSELRLALEPETQNSLTLEMMLAQQMFIGGASATPEVGFTYAFDIASRVLEADDGSATIEMIYNDVTMVDPGPMSPADVAQFEREMEGLMGLSFFVTIDDRGANLRTEVPRGLPSTGMGGLDDPLQEFDAPMVPLPDEAVGVGARWQVEQAPSATAALAMSTITEVELVELHDTHAVMSVNVVTDIEPSTVSTPQGTVELLGGEIVQNGTMTWFLDSAIPESELSADSTMTFTEATGGQQVEGELRQRMEVTATLHG